MTAAALFGRRDEDSARDALMDLGCTDGLPVIAPTPEKISAMMAMCDLDADILLGTVPPRGGGATIEMVAANAVMAGCAPHHFPVLVAAVRAMLEPGFDLSFIQPTTNAVYPGIIVNGPARALCGPIASGYGALGPGHHANASLGRALRLLLINLGGAAPGTTDMALLGVGKFACCFAEAEEESPFEPLHVARGFASDTSAVTLVAMDPPQAVISVMHDSDAAWADALLELIASTLAHPGTKGAYGGQGWPLVILNPDHARLLARCGHDRAKILDSLADRAAQKVGILKKLNPKLVETVGRRWGEDALICPCPPDRTLLVVAGGAGYYSFVSHSWQGGPNCSPAVTLAFDPAPVCIV